MKDSLSYLETQARQLEDQTLFAADAQAMLEHAQKFLREIANAEGAFLETFSGQTLREFFKISDEPKAMPDILELMWQKLYRHGFNASSGKFMGYIPGGGVPHAALGDFMASLSNRYAGVFAGGPAAASLENELVLWLCRAIGLPETAFGSLTSGGTVAVLLGMIAARTKLEECDYSKAVIYYSLETHRCLQRSLIVAGMQRMVMRPITVDKAMRMDINHLEATIAEDRALGLYPAIVVGNAGTVNTGAVDPLADIARVARREDLWFHVDGCYGGAFAMLPECQDIFQGISDADSIALDPHKGFFQPYGIGAALIRDGEKLRKELTYTADYLADVEREDEYSPADYSLELTRPFRGLRFWLSLQRHGLDIFQDTQREKLKLAQYLYEELCKISYLECGPKPELSIVAFRLKNASDTEQKKLLDHILASGLHVSSTKLSGQFYLRACILCFRTHLREVQCLVEACRGYSPSLSH